jgi:hypothetical protein
MRSVSKQWAKASRTPLAWDYSHFDAEWIWQRPLLALAKKQPWVKIRKETFPTFRVARRYGCYLQNAPSDEIYAAERADSDQNDERGSDDGDRDDDDEDQGKEDDDEEKDDQDKEEDDEDDLEESSSRKAKKVKPFRYRASQEFSKEMLDSMPYLRSFSSVYDPEAEMRCDPMVTPASHSKLERLVLRTKFDGLRSNDWANLPNLRVLELTEQDTERNLDYFLTANVPSLQVIKCYTMSLVLFKKLVESPIAKQLRVLRVEQLDPNSVAPYGAFPLIEELSLGFASQPSEGLISFYVVVFSILPSLFFHHLLLFFSAAS